MAVLLPGVGNSTTIINQFILVSNTTITSLLAILTESLTMSWDIAPTATLN